jgi:cytochrome c oxidase subunit 4
MTDTHEHESHTTHHDAPHHPDHPSDGKYIQIALILGAITAVEVAASYIDIGKLFVPLLVVCMVLKFGIVAAFFMHLRFDNALYRRLFVAGLAIALVVYTVVLLTFHVFVDSDSGGSPSGPAPVGEGDQ